uniref:DUF4371 domain-containing protein n=1 Tax=Onchocerca flexuosa TaxID=387005 RepID=A0A183I5N3_9BILA
LNFIFLQGTTSGDVCFHLLLDANAANITDIGFNCKLISTNIVQVDFVNQIIQTISLRFLTDVLMIKDSLKNRVRNRLTASQILAAVIRISDNDNQDNTKYPMLNAILTFRDSGSCSMIH